MEKIAKKVVLVVLLVASCGLLYWQHATEQAEKEAQEKQQEFAAHFRHAASLRASLLNPETANYRDLTSLKDFLRWYDLPSTSLGITKDQMETIERNIHRHIVTDIYKQMKERSFTYENFKELREEAKLAGLNLKDVFNHNEVIITAIQKDGHILVENGWRKATAAETEEFKAIEAKEEEERRQYELKKKEQLAACHRDYPTDYFLSADGRETKFMAQKPSSGFSIEMHSDRGTLYAQIPDGAHMFNIREADYCLQFAPSENEFALMRFKAIIVGDSLIIQSDDWRHLEGDDYEVKTYEDIAPTLAEEHLVVANGHIY